MIFKGKKSYTCSGRSQLAAELNAKPLQVRLLQLAQCTINFGNEAIYRIGCLLPSSNLLMSPMTAVTLAIY